MEDNGKTMSDPEVDKINQKKLKEKGAKVVQKQEAANYESMVMQLSQYLNDTGLHMMNVSTDLRNIIANERQRKNSAIQKPDSEKQ